MPGMRSKKKRRRVPGYLISAVLIGMLALPQPTIAVDRHALLDEANILLLPRERNLPAITLVDEQGKPFSAEQWLGRWHLVFFGFTSCPDVCPTTLSDMRRLFSTLPDEVRNELQLVLVTADPARDTPDKLETYLSYYRAGFKGLTGEMAALQQLSRALGLPFVPAKEAEGNYSVSHSGNIALVSPEGKLQGHIRAPLALEGLQRALPDIMQAK